MEPTAWIAEVGSYVDQLEEIATGMGLVLEEVRIAIRTGPPEEVRSRSEPLEGLNERLATAADQRQRLLEACPLEGPAARRSLTAALRHLNHTEAARLATRCEQTGAQIAALGEMATAMFIANYHLIQTTADVIRLITTGAAKSPTYDRAHRTGGGSVLDRAA